MRLRPRGSLTIRPVRWNIRNLTSGGQACTHSRIFSQAQLVARGKTCPSMALPPGAEGTLRRPTPMRTHLDRKRATLSSIQTV